jgi:hypothetical protein
MTVVAEVADALKLVSDVVKNTRTIVEAVNDGQKFLKRYHPEAQADLSALLEEVQKSISGLAQVSSVVTGFQFTVAGAARDLEPRVFNNYVIASKVELQEARDRKNALRASCKKIEEHRAALSARAQGDWWNWIGLLGEKRQERRQDLALTFDRVYSADQDIVLYVDKMIEGVEIALREVSAALASDSSGGALPENVPKAQLVLAEYAAGFESVDRECRNLVGELRRQIDGLR